MLRLIPPTPPLSAAEQFALEALVDQSRVLPVDAAGAVELRIVGSGAAPSIADARARKWCVTPGSGFVELERRLLSLVADLAGAVQEQRSTAEDRHGRVPSTENSLVRAGEEREPVVGHMAVALRKAAIAAGAGRCVMLAPWPEGKRWAMAMTHDLDIVALWPAYSLLRIGELLRSAIPYYAFEAAAATLRGLGQDPVRRAAWEIMRQEQHRNVRSTWFIIAGTPTFSSIRAGDVTYAPEHPLVRSLVAELKERAFEVGLHGSFASFVSRDAFAQQRRRLAAVAGGAPPVAVRQHFVRMRPGVSQVAMVDAGFQYDSTFGFYDRNGFRLGVADVIPVWDERGQRVLPIDEVPFVWMDRALAKYQKVSDPLYVAEGAVETAKVVRDVEGVWTGIWHPNMDDALGFPRAPGQFRQMLDEFAKFDPWSATLGEIVAWRRARRAARATALPASGPIPVTTSGAALALEDSSGKRVAHVNA